MDRGGSAADLTRRGYVRPKAPLSDAASISAEDFTERKTDGIQIAFRNHRRS